MELPRADGIQQFVQLLRYLLVCLHIYRLSPLLHPYGGGHTPGTGRQHVHGREGEEDEAD